MACGARPDPCPGVRGPALGLACLLKKITCEFGFVWVLHVLGALSLDTAVSSCCSLAA